MRHCRVIVAMFLRMEDEAENLGGPEPVAQPPLGEWRAPLFWMACGALLAGLAAGAVILAQRVGVERDMAAVAGMLPPPAAVGPDAHAPSATAPGPAAAAGAPSHQPSKTAPRLAAEASVAPAARGPAAVAARTQPASPATAPVARRAPSTAARVAGGTAAARAPSVRKPSAQQGRKVAARPKAKPHAKRKPPPESTLYWEVFKRCPLPGEPGAVECRRHICNGAEREGPACKPYRKNWR